MNKKFPWMEDPTHPAFGFFFFSFSFWQAFLCCLHLNVKDFGPWTIQPIKTRIVDGAIDYSSVGPKL